MFHAGGNAGIQPPDHQLMKITVNRLGVLSSKFPDRWISSRLAAIAGQRQIDEARVRIVRHRDLSPACEVSIHLATPGPDLFSSGADHTVMAAFDKALAGLTDTLAERTAKRLRRLKGRQTTRRGNVAVP